MKAKVESFISSNTLFSHSNNLLVALSGGADSVALLRVLLDLGYRCKAAHCNFHLRGEESERDEEFVRHLCKKLEVPLYVAHFDTLQEAKQRKVSIEMAARALRYDWFEEVRKECEADVIAVAHHRDDSAETFLLNLLRGTGINGLRGIRPRNGYVVRPLLGVDRSEILSYLQSIRQDYVTDCTNLQDEYLRNKIRLHLLPLMEEINPAVKANILRTASHLDEAALIYAKGVDDSIKRVQTESGIHIPTLLSEVAPEAVLHELLSPYGFNSAQIQDILHSLFGQAGKQFLSATHRVVKDRDYLLLSLLESSQEKPLLQMEERAYDADFVIPRLRNVACLDADKLTGALSLRLAKSGDSFVPFGMKGRKKLSDYMTDRKFSLLQKSAQWVLCSGEEICWLVDERVDNRFRVDASTRRILLITHVPS